MSIVTYLLGAGASAECIPVVNKMAEDINKTIDRFELNFNEYVTYSGRKELIKSQIINDLRWLSDVCRTHYSVDTYAKKLHLVKSEDLIKLKNVLSLYFIVQQKLEPLDKRYDNFWASILDSAAHLPKSLRIISWNYDYQLELSYTNFSNSKFLSEASKWLGICSFHGNSSDIITDEFGIFKLNGSAKFIEDKGSPQYLIDNMGFDFRTFYESLFSSYEYIKDKGGILKNELSFAWEHDLKGNYYQKLKESVFNTTVLVVIGYSFPVFNRKIDKLLLTEFMPNLHTVYFQAPDAENLQERFNTLVSSSIRDRIMHKHLIKDKNQFAFPNELDIY